ncbi:hypothetical protein CUMW_030130 [Citrus unshiu]|nr:hypothetical protein CUMW_030130 [Citrus unshiu]
MHKIKTPQMKPTPPHGTTKNTAISIEQCNEQRGLQSAQNLINLEDYYDDDDDLHVLNFLPNDTHFGKRKRPFSCKVPWHAGMRCEKFRKLNKNEKNSEDMELIKLAEEKKWKRCPHCNYSV